MLPLPLSPFWSRARLFVGSTDSRSETPTDSQVWRWVESKDCCPPKLYQAGDRGLYGCFHGLWWVIQLINVNYTIWCNGWISKLEVCTLRSKLGSLIRKVFANKRAKLRAERRSKKSGIWWELQWLNDLLSWSEIYITVSKWPVVSFDFVWSFQIRGVFDVFWWGFLSSWKPSSEWPNSCEGRGMYSLLPP